MTNPLASQQQSMPILRRDLEELFDEVALPRRMRREMDRLFGEASSPASLWRDMDQLLDEFASPPTLRRRIERVFDRILPGRGLTMRGGEDFIPPVELVERNGVYIVRVDLPGVREKDVDLQISDDNVLTVRGERRESEMRHVAGYEYSERRYGMFSRSVTLPPNIESSHVQAVFRDGVLEIRIPKAEPARQRKVPITREELRSNNGEDEKRH